MAKNIFQKLNAKTRPDRGVFDLSGRSLWLLRRAKRVYDTEFKTTALVIVLALGLFWLILLLTK